MANFRLSLGLAFLAFAFSMGAYIVFSHELREDEAVLYSASFVFIPIFLGSWLTISNWKWCAKANDF